MQKTVAAFIQKYNLQSTAEVRYIDLVSEIGELGKEILTATKYGKREYEKTQLISATIEEVGDCIFSLLALCQEMGVSAEDALNVALDKYACRFAASGSIGNNGLSTE